MCVIINRKPGIEIPYEKIASACTVNPDGYGLIFLDRGKMEIKRGYDDKGTDPDQIMKLLEDAKDINVVMHLRYTTVGKKNLSNTHPYTVLNNKEHGMDLQFMHNGTVSGADFRDPKGEFSDSHHFNKKVLTPLFERSLCLMDQDQLFNDPLIDIVMKQYAGTTSVFTLVDNNGNVKIVNKDRGKDYDGWWASNEYSFRSNYRSSSGTGSGYYYQGGSSVTPLSEWKGKQDNKAPTTTPAGSALLPATKEDQKLLAQSNSLTEAMASIANAEAVSPASVVAPEYRKTFCDITGLQSLEQTMCFEQDDVWELVSVYPEAATLLVMDLIYEMYIRQQPKSKEVTSNVH